MVTPELEHLFSYFGNLVPASQILSDWIVWMEEASGRCRGSTARDTSSQWSVGELLFTGSSFGEDGDALIKWIRYGSKGVKLEAIKFGTHWRTSEEALQRFGDRQTPSQEPAPPTITMKQMQRQNEAANEQLELWLSIRRCDSCKRELNTHKKTIPKNEKLWCPECILRLPNATIGQRLRAFRWDANVSQQQLGKKAGIAVTEIRAFEQEKKVPSKDQLLRLADVFDAEFLSGLDFSK
jgi:DNA-binding XRE family transcriptional regulator